MSLASISTFHLLEARLSAGCNGVRFALDYAAKRAGENLLSLDCRVSLNPDPLWKLRFRSVLCPSWLVPWRR
jgi:hypothetical protein